MKIIMSNNNEIIATMKNEKWRKWKKNEKNNNQWKIMKRKKMKIMNEMIIIWK